MTDNIYITIGDSCKATRWETTPIAWSDFVARCTQTRRTPETIAAYLKWHANRDSKVQCTRAKDAGGFVGATLKQSPGPRKGPNIDCRTLITLDVDEAAADFKERAAEALAGLVYVAYTTHSHTPEAPRWRVIIPIDRPATPHEFEAVSRRIAGSIGIDQVDPASHRKEQLFFWPTTSEDGVFDTMTGDGAPLAVDEVLNSYDNWRNPGEWPHGAKEPRPGAILAGFVDGAGSPASGSGSGSPAGDDDPRGKTGWIGAFCRVYSVPEAIDKFLPDVYRKTRQRGRYTYTGGSTAGGACVMEAGLYLFSHHSTDPAGNGHRNNAFDLVRLHKFGAKDAGAKPRTPVNRLPSFLAMEDLCLNDPRVRAEAIAEKDRAVQAAFADFAYEEDSTPEEAPGDPQDEEPAEDPQSWMQKLNRDKKLNILNSMFNMTEIVKHDARLACIRYDEVTRRDRDMSGRYEGRKQDAITDAALINIQIYIEERYLFKTTKYNVRDALTATRAVRAFNPVKESIEATQWDGIPRVDELLIRYFNTPDTPLNRAIIRKWMIAAVRRIYEPGYKFDNVLTLHGPQGTGKSTFFAILGGRWFTDNIDLLERGKGLIEKIIGFWIIELAELTGYSKADNTKIKSFLTSTVDTFRPAYAADDVSYPRQCVFAATTNKDNFLKDGTEGNRRFWVVEAPGRDDDWFDDLRANVDQIWAEALQLYRSGEETVLPRDLKEEITDRQWEASEDKTDPLRFEIRAWLDGIVATTVDPVVHCALFLRDKGMVLGLKYTTKEARRFNNIMATFPDWEKTDKTTIPGLDKRQKGWRYKGEAHEGKIYNNPFADAPDSGIFDLNQL